MNPQSTTKLLTDSDVGAAISRYERTFTLWFLGGAVTLLLWLGGLVLFQDDIATILRRVLNDFGVLTARIVLMAMTPVPFLAAIYFADRRTRHDAITYPHCSANVLQALRKIRVTRCCPECSERIVEGGRTRSAEVWKRMQRIEIRHTVQYVLWAMPAITVWTFTWPLIDPPTWNANPHIPFTCGLVSMVVSGWMSFETRHRRYLPSFFVSIILAVISAVMLWRNTYNV